MKKLFTLIILCCSLNSYAETSVWKAEKDQQTIYLGGTVHILRATDYPLPEAYNTAYKASQILTFETDIAALSSPEFQQQMILSLSYAGEKTIANQTSPEVYKALNEYAASLGLSLEYMKKAKPGMLMSAFTMMELQKMGVTQEGIDLHFAKLAKKDGKSIKYFETPQEQVSFIAKLGLGNENKFYTYLLKDLKNTKQQFLEILKSWRSGNDKEMDKIINLAMKDFPKMNKLLLIDRNNNWMPNIEKYFDTKEVEFVLVGAAHLIGEDGVINMLKKKGYKITQL